MLTYMLKIKHLACIHPITTLRGYMVEVSILISFFRVIFYISKGSVWVGYPVKY